MARTCIFKPQRSCEKTTENLIELTDTSVDLYIRGTIIEALKDITLEIAKGERILLRGPLAAGKRTLLNLMAGMVQFSGTYFLDGENIAMADSERKITLHRRKIGYVKISDLWKLSKKITQDQTPVELKPFFPANLKRSVFAFITEKLGHLKLKKGDLEKLVLATTRSLNFPPVLLTDWKRKKVKDLDRTGKFYCLLAREFVIKPKIMLLDDISSNVTHNLDEEVLKKIIAYCESIGTSLVYVQSESNENFENYFDRVVWMERGKITRIEQGGSANLPISNDLIPTREERAVEEKLWRNRVDEERKNLVERQFKLEEAAKQRALEEAERKAREDISKHRDLTLQQKDFLVEEANRAVEQGNIEDAKRLFNQSIEICQELKLSDEISSISQQIANLDEKLRETAIREQTRLTRLKEVLAVTSVLSISRLADVLEMEEAELWKKVFSWAREFGFTINDDKIEFQTGNKTGFIAELEAEFARWNKSTQKR